MTTIQSLLMFSDKAIKQENMTYSQKTMVFVRSEDKKIGIDTEHYFIIDPFTNRLYGKKHQVICDDLTNLKNLSRLDINSCLTHDVFSKDFNYYTKIDLMTLSSLRISNLLRTDENAAQYYDWVNTQFCADELIIRFYPNKKLMKVFSFDDMFIEEFEIPKTHINHYIKFGPSTSFDYIDNMYFVGKATRKNIDELKVGRETRQGEFGQYISTVTIDRASIIIRPGSKRFNCKGMFQMDPALPVQLKIGIPGFISGEERIHDEKNQMIINKEVCLNAFNEYVLKT